ncbi:hypothetical protein [Wolbachia endosymbiont of Folsomia candida]|uniref:hypothetical protein n=1 Tax=Wolbachia endosymbiont of Folsomia candida TaxID=169402 RepID=UPI000AF576DE|nr:hypothetical protein [Wolbachia endosymbiont of Folsomia candida]APR98330.1 hypothetical protein ASM33_03450 [Wolbachia endosymbiont of Folsomia candida]
MARTVKFEKLVSESFRNKFPGRTAVEQFHVLITDPMMIQILSKNKEKKSFIDEDKESIELLKIILAREKVFVQQYDGPHDSKLRRNDRYFYSDKFLRGELSYSSEFLFGNRIIHNKFYRDGLSEFLLKLLNNRNFFYQMKSNRKNIMLFLLLFEYESNCSDSHYCKVEYKRAIYSNARRPFIIKFQFPECISSMEIEDCPLDNHIMALYVRNMIRDENFINYLVSNEVNLNDFVEGISAMKYKNRDIATELLKTVMKELLKNEIFMNKVTENLDTITKMLKSDIVASLLENRSFIIDLVRENKAFIIHMAEIAGYETKYLKLNIRIPENNDTLLVKCFEATLRDALTRIIDREEEVEVNVECRVPCKDKLPCMGR